MTNLDYVKSLNASDLIKFFEDYFVSKYDGCDNCPICSICDDILCADCVETLKTWFEMERNKYTFKDLKVGDKFKETTKKNDDIYIKTTGGFAFNIQTGEGSFYDTENKVYKVADIEVKEKE